MQTFNFSKIRSMFDHYFIVGNFKQIMIDGQTLLEHAFAENDTEKMKLSYLTLIKASYYLGEFEKAYEYMLHYEQLISKLDGIQEDFYVHYLKAHLYEHEKNFTEVQQAIEKCTTIATKSANYSQLCRIKIFYSHLLLTNGQLELALDEAQSVKEIAHLHAIDELQLDFRCQLTIASVLHRVSKQTKPFDNLCLHPLALQNPFERCRLFYTQATNYIYNEDWELALKHLAEANHIAKQNNSLLMQIRITQQMVTIFEKLGYYKEALQAMKNLSEHKELLYETSLSSRLMEMNVKHNLEQIKKRANLDPLSGVYNRYYLEEHANTLLEQAILQDDHICCMVFDVDNFKAINDTYGHLVGDEVIKMLGQTCSSVLSDSETVVARYGGDEFVILSKSYGEQDVLDKSQRLFDAIADTDVCYENITVKISISMGIVCNRIVRTTLFSKLFQSADQALYAAKKQGKNQMVYVAYQK